ncbi:hypothetical protein ACY3ZY_002763, partial [Shigella flexneri]
MPVNGIFDVFDMLS